jgi:hypothetical protein
MSDVTPKRAARAAGQSKTSPDDAPAAAATPIVAEPRPALPVVAVQPDRIAEPAPEIPSVPADPPADSPEDPWAAFTEAQAALARGFEQIAAEAAGTTRSVLATAAEAAIALLGARTFSEAVEINAALARRGLDAMIAGSARLSEIGAKTAGDASQPVLSRLGASWSGMTPG